MMEREKRILDQIEKSLNNLENGEGHLHIPQQGFSRESVLSKEAGSNAKSVRQSHLHPYPEIFIQTAEKSLFSFQEGDYCLETGDILIIPPMTPHPEKVMGDSELFSNLVIMASPSQVNCHIARSREGFPRVHEPIMRLTRRGESVLALEKVILDIYERGDRRLILSLFRSLYFYLNELFEKSALRENPLNDKVVSACSIIRIEIENPKLNVDYLAGVLRCSRDYLSHLFHKEMGEKLTSYINRSRIIRAKNLLTDTSFNCSETAWACGFSTVAYFNRIFKNQTGVTPREFKKRR